MRIRTGSANTNGFRLKIEHLGVIHEFCTPGFLNAEEDKSAFKKMLPDSATLGKAFWILLISLFIAGCALHASIGSGVGVLKVLSIALGSFIAALGSLALSMYFFVDRSMRGWHACEHKLAHVLDDNKTVDLNSIESASRYHRNCGTNIFTGFTILGLLAVFFPLISLACSHSLLLMFIAFVLFNLCISYLTQMFVTTAEPAPEQYETALLLGLEIKYWANSPHTVSGAETASI